MKQISYNDVAKAIKKGVDSTNEEFVKVSKQEVINLYFEYKKKLETAVLLSDDKTKQPIVITIASGILVEVDLQNNKIKANISIVPMSGATVEQKILIAGWHGTGIGISDDIKEFIINKVQNIKSDALAGYYFDPSNADILFYNQVERLLEGKR